jgi:hypothetical protein
MYINSQGQIYFGDLIQGDRAATAEEIAAWELSRANQVPQRVTRFQAKAALLGAGLLEQVEVYMALPDTPMVTKLAWTETQDFERASPTVAGLAALLGLTAGQVDALFVTASGISA